jgi:hypothetical protein
VTLEPCPRVTFGERGLEMVRKNEKIKGVLLAIFFCLLMSSTANAQNAVLLWEKVLVMEIKEGALNENSQWTLLKAAPTYEQCTEAQRQVFEARKTDYLALKDSTPEMEVWTTPNKAVTVQLSSEPRLISNIFYCLPGTIDPGK